MHLAIDMQRIFAEPGPRGVPWLARVIPNIVELAAPRAHGADALPTEPEEMPGAWRDYCRHWRAMTRTHLDERLLDLVEPLQRADRCAVQRQRRHP